jgi:hypothetical protein
MLSLVLTGVLAWLLVGWSRLTGMGTEESMYLMMELGPGVKLKGVVLAGIIQRKWGEQYRQYMKEVPSIHFVKGLKKLKEKTS